MKNTLNVLVFVGKFVVVGLALAFVVATLAPNWTARIRTWAGAGPVDAPAVAAAPTAAQPDTLSPAGGAHPVTIASREAEEGSDNFRASYADSVARAAPGVVSIFANKLVPGRRMLVPNDPLLRRLVGPIDAGPIQRGVRSLGSGVIVRPDGYVLTNNHVIEGAEDIQAMLNDGRVAKATLVGSDPETDLAVLKLDLGELTNMTLSNRRLRVGDVVLAIGNPFGHGNTVTMGIVSGLGRQLDLSAYENFIQTDAAINEGNSGGALIDAYGDLVGINTAFKRDQNAEGVGFAIPAITAKNVLDHIIAQGKVIRGWIGAEYIDLASISPPGTSQGVMVQGVYENSPAAQAGLRRGDILLRINDDQIVGQLDLHNREASLAPGTKVRLFGLRNGSQFGVELTLQERPPLRQSNG